MTVVVVAGARALLSFAALLGACVWVGGFVAIVVVARVAREHLDHPGQVAFFRALGRRYLRLGGVALLAALGAGAALLARHRWDGTVLATVLVAAALLLVTVVGVLQARAMTRLRSRALHDPDPAVAARVRREARHAGALRAGIGLLSLALVALAAVLAT
ncbi:MAG TPA: hypothetical protein VHB30_01810 [Solirubrobacteraceae bacterium]|nr:hypothetical protein [Solirubrobacteraceae bacterium]